MQTNFYTAPMIANLLKISKALAYRLIAQGQIPSVRFGRVVRVREQDLENFIARNQNDGAGGDAFASQKWKAENLARR